ncbi:MAG: hypothetical protein FJ215_09715 [Ignavibacteria bacterium]|nr:hypothetical protein [Ignavibacteria bacterium]
MKRKSVWRHGRVKEEIGEHKQWKHPGGKLRELGPEALTIEELIAILISTGTKGKSATEIARALVPFQKNNLVLFTKSTYYREVTDERTSRWPCMFVL